MRGKYYRLLLLIWMMLPAMLLAQGVVRGTVTDGQTGEALPFANIMLVGTQHGATTDLNGLFIINRVPAGSYTLKATMVGYSDYTQELTLTAGVTNRVNITLKPSSEALQVVEVTASRIDERKQETTVSVEKITSAQIQQMPSIGGQADLAQYLQVLPGVNSTGDQGGQLYIRGGSMIQNLCMLDGMIVYNPFHSIGLYSIFETDVILNADIYTGGFGAEYGGRLSSVMDITTRDGNKKRHAGKVGLNTFGANVTLEGPLKRERADSRATITYLLTAKNSYLSTTSSLFYPYIDGGLPFDFADLYGKLSFNSGMGSKFNIFGFSYNDRVLGYQSIADYEWHNHGLGTNFVVVTGSSSIIDGTIAYSQYQVDLSDQTNYPKSSAINGFNAGINITNYYGKNLLKVGISMEGYTTRYDYTNQYGVTRSQQENTSNISAYGTYHANLGSCWIIDPGLRLVYYASLSQPSVEPRLAAKWMISDRFRMKLAGGLYSQILLDARSDQDVVNLFNGFLSGTNNLNLPTLYRGEAVTSCVQRAQHLVAGVEYDFSAHLIGNAEVYFKNFSQLLNMNSHQYYDRTDPVYVSGGMYEQPQYYLTDFIIERGYATGVDFSLCYDAERLYVWATYSLAYVERTDEVQTYNPHYDRRHTVNLMATYSLGEQKEWELSGRWSFGSGFPFTQTLGVYEDLSFGGSLAGDYRTENGSYGVYQADPYGGRLPNYHRLDLGAKRRFSIGAHSILDVSLSITNVYNRDNIFYFDRLSAARVDQLPILVSLGVNFSF